MKSMHDRADSGGRALHPASREWRRFRAWHLKQLGCKQRDIATALDVSAVAVSRWVTAARSGGLDELRAKPQPGAPRRLTDDDCRELEVGWYGGGKRCVEVLEGTGHWYKAGKKLVPIRWVFVRDKSGTHRDEYFFTTDLSRSPTTVIGHYCGRWNIETTFQESRSCLGLESTRGWCAKTVLRAGPCLLGLYSVVAILFNTLPESKRVGGVSWPGKETVTFSDALCAVRRWLWDETILPQAGDGTALKKLPQHLRELLLTTLAPAP